MAQGPSELAALLRASGDARGHHRLCGSPLELLFYFLNYLYPFPNI